MTFLTRLMPLAALALACLAAAPSAAAPKQIDPTQPTFVDLKQVYTEYQKTQAFGKYTQRLREQARNFTEEMKLLSQIRYSNEEERKEALAIRAKPNATPKEQARLDELKKKTDAVDNELAALAQKSNPSDADAKRIQELSAMRTEGVRTLTREEANRRDQLRKTDADILEEVQGELLKVVEKVAKDHKVVTVYNRTSVLFGGNDLTDEVVKKLPK